jgi:hypothetical protein
MVLHVQYIPYVKTRPIILYLLHISEIESNEDTVFAIDLEKAIEYSIMTEIPSQPELNTVKLQVFYRWLEALTKYVSMRNEIWQFLSATKTWMSQNVGGLQGLRGNMLSNKLNELSAMYHPFEETSEDWKGKISY